MKNKSEAFVCSNALFPPKSVIAKAHPVEEQRAVPAEVTLAELDSVLNGMLVEAMEARGRLAARQFYAKHWYNAWEASLIEFRNRVDARLIARGTGGNA
jgi:hypothetical protein